jgi:16S rRNA (adenine1518-N6/adenine1519-N6)-dimethyltransferase
VELSLLAQTRGILERYNLRAQKGLSQNFLVSESILKKILETVNPQKNETILEVGAGLGILTESLLKSGANVLALEIDPKLFEILKERLQAYNNLVLHCQNILKFSPGNQLGTQQAKGVGNLPYHLSGSILRWFLDNRNFFSGLFFMLQKEVAERIVSSSGSKTYGVLSVLCQAFTKPEICFFVPPEAFFPIPNVESAFLKMTPKSNFPVNEIIFTRLVKQAFSQRRKTLYNNLKSWKILNEFEWKKILQSLDINEKIRGEALSIHAFIKIAEIISS